jgi:hypothetical protein
MTLAARNRKLPRAARRGESKGGTAPFASTQSQSGQGPIKAR